MEATSRLVGKCMVLDCRGHITLGPATLILRKAIREAVQAGPSRIVVNLDNVTHIDSCGLGEMISGYVHAKNQGGQLILLNVSKEIQTLIANMRLLDILEIYDDEQKALEGCE